jgi:PTH2 family peptidyl-tRNA hydrolase
MTKQVIVIRKDLKMRRGKEVAQGSHASSAWLIKRIKDYAHEAPLFSVDELELIDGIFTKICVVVNSEAELREVHQKALDAGLESHLIIDSGKTEFNGEPTATCVGIGPADSDLVNTVTGHLSLY